MTTLYEQNLENQQHGVRRRATSKGLSFGPIATAITISLVAVMLGVTFVGDWLRTPTMTVETSPSIISPNSDKVQDVTNFTYTLNEDADVVVQVLDENGYVLHTLLPETFQTRGQHVVMWDGRDKAGQVVADGAYQLQVTGKGTMLAAQQTAQVKVDNVPPMLRLANLDETSRVREANFTIEGLTDADAIVRLADDPQIIPVDKDGKFTIKRQLLEGENKLDLIATDSAGNMAKVTRQVNLITRPPQIALTGALNDKWTNESLIEVAGTAPQGIAIKVNGQEASVSTAEGAFKHEVILQEGDNTIQIQAIDDVGNTTSQELIVHRKTTPPLLSLNVEEGAAFQQAEIQVMGKTDAGATVMVGGQAVSVSPVGEFQTTVKLLNGENLLDVVAQDQAGNITKRQKRLTYDILPPQPEWMRVMNNLPSMSTYLTPVAISLPFLLMLAYYFTRPVALVLSAESATFRPGLPEEGRFLRLAVELSKPARSTVEVKDRRGNTIATLQYRRHRNSGQQTLYWNGYDDFGRAVAPGDYTIFATASTTGGTVTSMVNISVLPEQDDRHYQYLRTSPQQEERQTVSQSPEYTRQRGSTTQRARR